MKKIILLITLILSTQVNAFTYQGELSQTGTLFTGTADIKFTLFDTLNGGVQYDIAYTYTGIMVENGRFTVNLDDWNGIYDGTPLWLEIAVDLNSMGSFTTLAPRQKLEPAPYAEFAYDGAGGVGDITGVIAGNGLTGGGGSGSVTLNVDPTVFQKRINATCPAGQSIRSINENSDIICEIDNDSGGDVTAVTAGTGLIGGGVSGDLTINIDDSEFQRRVSTFCPTGKYMYKITENGSAGCRDDISIDGSTLWHLGGNSGIDSENDFIGTTDNNSFSIRVNNQPASSIIPRNQTVNIIAGSSVNLMDIGADGSIIAGGGEDATSCGDSNSSSCKNEIHGDFSTISGGKGNVVNGPNATISGGASNVVEGFHSVVPGGLRNRAGGNLSWAGGASAIVRNAAQSGTPFGDSGTFIWNGSANVTESLTSTGQKQFLVRAPGGAWIGMKTGTISPTIDNVAMHVEANSGSDGLRVRINGNTKLKVLANGGVAIGTNYTTVPTNGLKVRGNVEIVGSLSKGGGSFKIDHPLDPENQYLYHSFVESPDMMNIYNGNVTTDKSGQAWVEMPDWFEALNMKFRYQLTVIGSFDRAMIAQEIADNKFLIRTETGNVKVSWQVTGIRHDPWAEKNRIPVEVEKKQQDKGHYLHPEAWNVDKKLAIGYLKE